MNHDIIIGLLFVLLGVAFVLIGLAIIWQARASELQFQAILLLEAHRIAANR